MLREVVPDGQASGSVAPSNLEAAQRVRRHEETPGDRHDVSANASATEPARLLAVFVVDTKETTLTTPIEK